MQLFNTWVSMIAGIHSISISGLKQSYGLAEKHYQFWKKKIRPNLTPLTCSLLLLLLVVRCETRILSVIQVFKSIYIGPARWLGLYECLPCHPDSLNFSPGAHSGKRQLDLKSYSLTSTLTLCQTPAYTYIHTCPHHLHIQVKFVVRIIYR